MWYSDEGGRVRDRPRRTRRKGWATETVQTLGYALRLLDVSLLIGCIDIDLVQPGRNCVKSGECLRHLVFDGTLHNLQVVHCLSLADVG